MYSIVYLYSSLERVTLLEYIRNLGGLGEACNFTLEKKCIVNFSKRLPLRSLFDFRYLPFPSVARVYPILLSLTLTWPPTPMTIRNERRRNFSFERR